MQSRPVVAALGLFFGGLVVGSSGGGSREGSAHAATTNPETKPSTTLPSAAARGVISPALERSTRRGLGREPAGAASCAQRPPPPSRRRDAFAPRPDDPLHGLTLPALPITHPAIVLSHLRYFTDSYEGRRNFTEALRRSGRFKEIIAKTFRERGLPPDLAAVALIESSFSPEAVSPQGATGLWQFMAGTAQAYGLIVDDALDERSSIWRATEAAANHLADLYERFHSWDLALAAYNLGYDGLERRLDEANTDDFWTLREAEDLLPDETASYVPKVLAAAIVLQNLEELGFGDVEKLPAIDATELEVPGGTSLGLVARAAGTSVRELRELNPEVLGDRVPDRGDKIVLHVPRSGASRARTMLPKLAADPDASPRVSEDFDWGKDDLHHKSSRLERTAIRTRPKRRPKRKPVAIEHVAEPEDKAKAAEPEETKREEPLKREEPKREDPKPAAPTETHVFYRVVPGDSVAQIAATVGLTVDQLLAQAHVSSPDEIRVGSLLDLVVPTRGVDANRRPMR